MKYAQKTLEKRTQNTKSKANQLTISVLFHSFLFYQIQMNTSSNVILIRQAFYEKKKNHDDIN